MHNNLTLDVMDAITVSLGDELRAFSQKTCAAFKTKELPREADARVRHAIKKSVPRRHGPAATAGVSGSVSQGASMPDVAPSFVQADPVPPDTRSNATRRNKTFNLSTYKLHSFGDYVATIRQYGTTDSYSTEPVCDFFI